jgi:hypothetical protein
LAETRADGRSIERLRSSHGRTAFDCGHPLLSEWFKRRASQFEKRDLARTYVATRSGDTLEMCLGLDSASDLGMMLRV